MNNYFKHKMRGKSPAVIVGIVLFGALFIGAMAILFGYIIMWLWNALMPGLFDLPTLTYWQAVGLFILAKILFGFGGGGSSHSNKSEYKDMHCKKTKEDKFNFSKWAHYEEFWKEKGESAYHEFVAQKEVDISEATEGKKSFD
jgi:hypothetical protein